MPPFRHVRRCLAGGALLTLGACMPHRQTAEPEVPANVLALEVENHNWSDVVIWIEHDGTRSRFLTVNAARSKTEAIPRFLVGTDGMVRFIAHRIGGGDDYYTSPKVSIRTGYTVSLTLEDDLRRSSVGVW